MSSELVCPVIHKVSENGTEAEKCPVPHNQQQQKPQQQSTGTSSHEDINEGIVGRGKIILTNNQLIKLNNWLNKSFFSIFFFFIFIFGYIDLF